MTSERIAQDDSGALFDERLRQVVVQDAKHASAESSTDREASAKHGIPPLDQ
jgi:hypothetical protein